MSAYSRTRRDTHLTYLDARIDWIIGLWIFVRSLGWDPGYHERFRNGPENKIHIRQCSFWSSELFRVNRYCTGSFYNLPEGGQRGPTFREGAWAYGGVSWPHWARGTRPHRAQPILDKFKLV